MSEEEFGYDEESFDFDDRALAYDTWTCAKCKEVFIDPEDYPNAKPADGEQVEPRLYWLSITEPLCCECAITSGIPPIDER
jgi:hypothetical protein